MSEQNWEIVLSYLYTNESRVSYLDEQTPPKKLDIVQKTGLSPIRLEDTLEYLYDIDLVEKLQKTKETATDHEDGMVKKEFVEYRLSQTGFKIAHEREIANTQQETNKRSVRLSGYLVIGIIIQALASFSSISGALGKVIYGLVIIGLLFLVLVDLGIGPLDLRSS